MKTSQGNSCDTPHTKATDWADTSTIFNSFEPQDEFQIFVKSSQIKLFAGLNSLHRKMDYLSGRYSCRFDEEAMWSIDRAMTDVTLKPCEALTACSDLDETKGQCILLANSGNRPPDYDVIVGENDVSTSTKKSKQAFECQKTGLTESEDKEENRPPAYHEIFWEDNLETVTKKCEKAFECQKTGPTDLDEAKGKCLYLAKSGHKPPDYIDVFDENDVSTSSKKYKQAFVCKKTGLTESKEKEENRPPAYHEIVWEDNLETVKKKCEKAFECQKTGPTDLEENRPPAYHEIFCKVNLETETKKCEKDFERQKTGLTDSEEKEENRPHAYDGDTCEENLETLTKNDKEAFECQQTDLTDSDEKGENRPPAYDGIFCEESRETLTKEDRDASFRETDNTSLREGPVYTNTFTDEIDTKEEDEHKKYNGNIHSTEENHELPKESINLTNKEKVCTNETAKMNRFRKHEDKTMSEEKVKEFSKAMQSVGILHLPHCTSTIFRAGTLFGITAAHIFATGKDIHGEQIRALLGHIATVVDFGPFNQHLEKFRLVNAVFFDVELDIAILKFRDEDKHKLPPPLYLFSNCDVSEFVDEVAVISVGHPSNNFKILEHDVKVIKRSKIPTDEIDIYLKNNYEDFKNKCISKGVDIGALNECYRGMMDTHNIILNAYSGHGASGAPVLSKTNPVSVVGVYTSGYPQIVYDIPELLPLFPPEFTFECATKTSYIFQRVVQFSEDLANDIFNHRL